MATRAIIKVEGITYCAVYKHWDGGPDEMLPWLKKFNADFTKARGNEPGYRMAQLLRSSVRDAHSYGLDDNHHTGYGIVSYGEEWGQEWEYILMADGTVTVVDL